MSAENSEVAAEPPVPERSGICGPRSTISIIASSWARPEKNYRLAGRIAAGVDIEVDGVEAADAVAVEAADVAGLAVVEQDLIALRRDRGGAQHDAGVGRPVGFRLEDQLEVAKYLV